MKTSENLLIHKFLKRTEWNCADPMRIRASILAAQNGARGEIHSIKQFRPLVLKLFWPIEWWGMRFFKMSTYKDNGCLRYSKFKWKICTWRKDTREVWKKFQLILVGLHEIVRLEINNAELLGSQFSVVKSVWNKILWEMQPREINWVLRDSSEMDH